MNFLVLFICSMIIPIVNTSSVSSALMSYEIDFMYSMIFLSIFGVAIKYLKKNKPPIVIIIMAIIAEDIFINLLCDIKFITYIMQFVLIIGFVLYTNHKKSHHIM